MSSPLTGRALVHPQEPRLDDLTVREREVLTTMATGWTNQEMAERLHLVVGRARAR
ncbi:MULTISPECIES: LuxR C-terminal-related transcriptional regulator [unclassified Streptomyces]|uniref:LuxR C-terminal-related transcriptional regulator n=1 Tax=unclassified Streptomyces TaxID=2593676 RepID=UPI0037FAE39A